MKRILLAALLLLLPGMALANNCVCPAATSCNLTTSSGWTTCGGTFPQATDSIVVLGNLSMNATGAKTYLSLDIQSGGVATCSFGGVATTYNFNTAISPVYTNGHEFFVVRDGGTLTCNGVNWTINWVGGTTGDTRFGTTQGNTTSNSLDATVTLRGVERAKTNVGVYSEGATTGEANFVDCIKYPAGFSPASTPVVGDTIVFTTGLSKEFWYKVSGVGTTTECTATSCGGSTCDLEIDRNATDSTPGSVASSSSWSSNTMIASLGGPTRHKTPVDNDANGTANSSGTRPVAGDAFVVFRPVLIQGGTNPLTNGILGLWGVGTFNVRYLELNKITGQQAGNCTAQGTALQSWFWDPSLAPEGDTAFLNIHNSAAVVGDWEVNATDDSSDIRPNRPAKWSHIYLHDTDAQIATTCPGQGVTNAYSGIFFSTDANTNLQINGQAWTGLHLARLLAGGFNVNGPQASGVTHQFQNIVIRDLLAHDIPNSATYNSANGGSAVQIASGANPLLEGVSVWDVGRASAGMIGALLSPNENSNVTGRPPTNVRLENAFIVNVDDNAADGQAIGGVDMSLGQAASDDTYGALISNSYISRIVGVATNTGRALFNFIKDAQIGDAGTCTAQANMDVVRMPVEATGNVITRGNANSCADVGIGLEWIITPSQYTKRTRRIVSNLITNLDTTFSTPLYGMKLGSNVAETRDVNAYNNVIDMNGNVGASGDNCMSLGGGTSTATNTAYYNTCMNCSSAGCTGIVKNTGTMDEGYNRFINVQNSPAVSSGNAASDIDSDLQDTFANPASNFYQQLCESSEKARSPWGGPVGPLAFGIRSFDRFLPAVLPLLDPDVFKMRFDWRECSASYQDSICR